ncbi:TonB-dependent receptor [Sphingomonas bacterium]|uniref:TonB-dependent receptor n=1 Tax=Sphingomonas bacterium TaxID=1895847 RepID=UPI0015774555|nr:TonB-dependent receptor [Sphingomonas bacterium]
MAQVPPAPTDGAAPGQVASAELTDPGVEDIVVTAQRREERLQDVPVAITAFTGSQLTRLGIDGSKQLTQVVPGLNFTQSVFSPQPTIRGIGTRGTSAGEESAVPIYIDGVYQSFIPAADLQFNNVDRIEVLKGPQGALFGRNSTGGAISIVTRQPTVEPTGALSLSYGRFDEVIAKGYGAAGSGNVAGDIAFVAHRDDGYIRDVVSGARYAKLDDFAVRSKIVAKVTENLELRFAVGHVENNDSTGEAYRPLDGNTIARRVPGTIYGAAPYTAALSIDPYNTLRQTSVSGTAILTLAGATITSVTGWQTNHLEIAADSDASSASIATLTYPQYSRNVYHETYVATRGGGPLSLIGGFVYFHDVSGQNPFVILSRPVSTAGVIGALSTSTFVPRMTADSYAGYLQGTYKVTRALSLTLGGRYTNETKQAAIDVQINAGPVNAIANRANFQKFTPSAILQFRPNERLNLYAKYGEGFKSGVFNSASASQAALQAVKPENVKQYEAGIKADPLPWLRIDIAGYYTDYRNLQSNARDPVTLATILQNAGSARIYGGEAELSIRPTRRLNLRAGMSALHGTYRDFPNAVVTIPTTTADPAVATTCVAGTGTPIGGNRSAVCDVGGRNIIRTPFVTADAGIDYSVPVGRGEVGFVGNLYYSGRSYWDTLNRLREAPYVLANGEISFRPGPSSLRIAIWGENLLDETYSLTTVSSATADTQVLARPRTFGIRLSYGR